VRGHYGGPGYPFVFVPFPAMKSPCDGVIDKIFLAHGRNITKLYVKIVNREEKDGTDL